MPAPPSCSTTVAHTHLHVATEHVAPQVLDAVELGLVLCLVEAIAAVETHVPVLVGSGQDEGVPAEAHIGSGSRGHSTACVMPRSRNGWNQAPRTCTLPRGQEDPSHTICSYRGRQGRSLYCHGGFLK